MAFKFNVAIILFWIGILTIVATHIAMYIMVLPESQQIGHATLNIFAVVFILIGHFMEK